MYCLASFTPDPMSLVSAWKRSLPADAVFAGRTAAWLHGLDLEAVNPVEVAVPARSELRSRQGVAVWRCDIDSSEICAVRGMHVTTLARTLLDLCARRPAIEALIAVDMAVRKRGNLNLNFNRRPGAARLRRLAHLAAPAESPMETRLRWLLIAGRLPAPEVQADLHDSSGRFIARVDLLYRAARLVIEFDGGNHRERLVSDDRRQNLLMSAGFRLLRFTSADVYQRPGVVAAQVRGALTTPALSVPA
jgi:very-short-patch-repair endonuclease